MVSHSRFFTTITLEYFSAADGDRVAGSTGSDQRLQAGRWTLRLPSLWHVSVPEKCAFRLFISYIISIRKFGLAALGVTSVNKIHAWHN